MYVLIIDDEDRFVTETAEFLRNKRLGTLQAHSSGGAERILCKHSGKIAVALVDMFMGTDLKAGLNLIRLMKREYPWIVPIVLTGHASLANAAECIEAGAFQYLPKDICPPSLLLQTVRQAIDHFSMLSAVQAVADKCEDLQKRIPGLMEALERFKDERSRGRLQRSAPKQTA